MTLGHLGVDGIPSLKKTVVKLLNTAGISGWPLQNQELKKIKMISVYNLINPIDKSIFYVGCTKNPYNRFYNHYQGDNNIEKSNLIKKIRLSGYKPIMNILKEVDNIELAEFIEAEYIELYKFKGCNLLNKNNGGNKPPSQKGNFYTAERKLNSFVKSPLKKTVYQVDKNDNIVNVFLSTREAGRLTGIDYRSISQVANGSLVRKTAGGFKWLYK
jgi:predicted GIY-YIG superfamily endonuclease